MSELIAAPDIVDRMAMIVHRGSDGSPQFAASGYLLGTRLVISSRHSLDRPASDYEVWSPGRSAPRTSVTAVIRHRIEEVDLALLVLEEDAPPITPARWAVLPKVAAAIPFVAVGYPDHALRQGVQAARQTRQLTGSILLGSFLSSHEVELSLSSPAPRHTDESPWRGISGAGVTTNGGVLVGLCTSHHVPSGTASLTATGLSRMTDDAEFARLLAKHEVEPVPLDDLALPSGTTAGQGCVQTHADVMRGLLGRRSFLGQERLPFVHPGSDHPSHPDRLFDRLSSASPRGVLLIGPAGSGKTRTSLEVARRARRAGWQVLHVQADAAATVDDMAAAVLSCERRRILLVLDYIDACTQLDLRALSEVLVPEARRRGVTLACFAAVRPGALRAVQLRGSSSVLDEVHLRDDWPHQAAVIAQVIRHAAPETVQLWGGEALARLCGRRPITALLIALAIEEQGLARLQLPIPVSARPGELLDWLREGIRRDALATAEPGPSPSRITSPDTSHLAFAVAVAATPQPRETVEQAVNELLETVGGPAGSHTGRRVVDTLIALGWLDDSDGRLTVVHDVVTDELLLESLLPPPGWSVDERSAASVFSALARQPRTFVLLTGHVRRLAADLEESGSSSRIAALERFCGEWITTHADPLGCLLADAGRDGGQALLTLVTSRPWQGFDHSTWGHLVEPWLVRAEADHIAQPFLTAALRNVDRVTSCLVEASLGWLARRGDQTDAESLLLALLDTPDLTPEAEDVAVDHALSWIPSRPGWRHTPALLKRLLRMCHADNRLERVVAVVRDWLTPYRSFGVAPVIRAFLQRADTGAAARQEIIDRMITWLRTAYRTGLDIGPELCVLLEHDGLPDPDRARLARCAMDWLEQQRTHPKSGPVLRSLLSDDGCPPDLRSRLITFARRWATERSSGLPGCTSVIDALLSDDGSAPGTVAVLLAQLAEQPDSPSAPAQLRSLLLHYQNFGHDQKRAVVTYAFAWLDGRPAHEECVEVFEPLLSVPDLSFAELRHAVRMGTTALLERRNDNRLMAVLLSQLEGLSAEQARAVADVSLEWLAYHGGKAQRSVLASFLTRPDVSVEQAHRGIDIALDRLSTATSTKNRPMLSGVLRHPALDESRRYRAVDCALRWLSANSGLPKARLIIEDLLMLPALPADVRRTVMRSAEEWLTLHGSGDETSTYQLRAALGRSHSE